MIKCPRCYIQQQESPQCEYCGLIYEEFLESRRTSKTAISKRTAWLAIIIIIAVALPASYWFIFSRHKTNEKSTIVEISKGNAPKIVENDLRPTVNELSGDVGMINRFADGSTKGSIIAMAVFSIIGLGYLTYGKKSQKLLMVVFGIALMGYSYFVDGTVYIILVGAGLSALPFILGRR